MRLLSTRTIQMRVPSTTTMAEDGDKHKNNENKVPKHKNNANEVAKHKNNANESAKHKNNGRRRL